MNFSLTETPRHHSRWLRNWSFTVQEDPSWLMALRHHRHDINGRQHGNQQSTPIAPASPGRTTQNTGIMAPSRHSKTTAPSLPGGTPPTAETTPQRQQPALRRRSTRLHQQRLRGTQRRRLRHHLETPSGGDSSSVSSQPAPASLNSSPLAPPSRHSKTTLRHHLGILLSGGDSSSVGNQLSPASLNSSPPPAPSRRQDDGSVITWGNSFRGGDSSSVSSQLGSGVA